MADSSLRLRPWVSLILFISAYSPLMVIMAIKQIDLTSPNYFNSPEIGIGLLVAAIISSVIVLQVVKSVRSGLMVVVSKASNKSGDMFGYTIPYMMSFMRIDLTDWQTILADYIIFDCIVHYGLSNTNSIYQSYLGYFWIYVD
ncbi:hypothetical protein [Aggregatibacter actinomycetemcomitans]|uniref:hypothetical protein n=2 Tax=Aggregatibacter actinomycetemcomitans TaxID=714 RepID=UPI001E3608DE|nr:hypothetical protein [Aggregatibacter actinomycetemcomitans]